MISNIYITPTIPHKGLLGYCSFVLFDTIAINNVKIITRLDQSGSIRLRYPIVHKGSAKIDVCYPVNMESGSIIERAVEQKCKELNII